MEIFLPIQLIHPEVIHRKDILRFSGIAAVIIQKQCSGKFSEPVFSGKSLKPEIVDFHQFLQCFILMQISGQNFMQFNQKMVKEIMPIIRAMIPYNFKLEIVTYIIQ